MELAGATIDSQFWRIVVDLGFAISVARSSIVQLMILTIPILGASIVIGLIVSIFQATTSIQEQTLTFVPKIAAIIAVLYFLGPWMATTLIEFTQIIFSYIPEAVR